MRIPFPYVLLVVLIITAWMAAPSAEAAAASTPRPVPCRDARAVGGSCWSAPAGTTLFWQLSGRPDHDAVADAYDIDGFEATSAFVTGVRRRGRASICYVSAGSHEVWRPDAGEFPASIIGEPLDGWPGERWLDIRRIGALAPIMQGRMNMCRRKGFDAIEFDNMDAYANDSGFPLTFAHQLRYNRWLADNAHARGLAVSLKNDPDQVRGLVRWFDFAIVEECFRYEECPRYSPFVAEGKAVFVAEYSTPLGEFCPAARRLRFHAARYPLSLDGRRWPCS